MTLLDYLLENQIIEKIYEEEMKKQKKETEDE